MAATINISIKGLDAAMRSLNGYAQQAEARVALAVEATAIDVENQARQNAPVDTATLQRSIVRERITGRTWRVFTNVAYARRQEFGFVGTDRLGRRYNQAGRFYMTRAAERARPVLLERLRRALQPNGGAK